ncbi:MAG: hypothetical protein AAF548_16160 [Actinomycetota bacterium]
MTDSQRARLRPSGDWDRARRCYRDLLGDDDPVAGLVLAGALDLRPGFVHAECDPSRQMVLPAEGDLGELRAVVEAATGVGTWPSPSDGPGDRHRVGVAVARPAALLGLLLAMDGLIERRSPWGKWRTMVDTMAARVAEIEHLTMVFRVVEPDA